MRRTAFASLVMRAGSNFQSTNPAASAQAPPPTKSHGRIARRVSGALRQSAMAITGAVNASDQPNTPMCVTADQSEKQNRQRGAFEGRLLEPLVQAPQQRGEPEQRERIFLEIADHHQRRRARGGGERGAGRHPIARARAAGPLPHQRENRNRHQRRQHRIRAFHGEHDARFERRAGDPLHHFREHAPAPRTSAAGRESRACRVRSANAPAPDNRRR